LKVPIEKIRKYDGETCFICGKYLLNNTHKDLAYLEVHTGSTVRAIPDKYYLFTCPSCGKIGHKRCWYDYAEKRVNKSWFGLKYDWQLVCPSCGVQLSPARKTIPKWEEGYQIPGHPDEELIELHIQDVLKWKAGSVFGKIGAAIGDFFKAVGLGSLTDTETSAIARAAQKVGRTIKDVAEKVFKLDVEPVRRSEIKELKCQNCGASLPLLDPYEEAVVCEHCGTAHLLPA
jgi:ribosomal protein S27E